MYYTGIQEFYWIIFMANSESGDLLIWDNLQKEPWKWNRKYLFWLMKDNLDISFTNVRFYISRFIFV